MKTIPSNSTLFVFAFLALAALSLAPIENSHAQTFTRTITDPVGNAETWVYQENLGVYLLLSKTSQVDGKGVTNQYDANNNVISRIDAEGRETVYTYNSNNQKTSMTEAYGTSESRTTSYEYVSSDIDLVTKVIEPSLYPSGTKETITTYDANLNPTSVTINGFKPDGTAISRTTTYSYNSIGQVITIDGPRTAVSDITTFTYNNCNTGGGCGQLATVTNAEGHVTTYDSYNAGGQLLQSTDPNGTTTSYTYDSRNRVSQMTVTPQSGSSRTTSYLYDGVGQVIQMTMPDGMVITNTYNAARYLSAVEDNLGNRIEYSYDLKGNRIKTETKDNLGNLDRIVETAFDHRDFVIQINTGGSITDLVKDAAGNLTAQTDPNLNPSTNNQYDGLDRLNQTIDALGGQTHYGYDVQDQLTQVISPNGATTDYVYDDLGNRLSETSPDRGLITYTHDEAGNVTSTTDARGITATYTYDALNRLTAVQYPTATENVSYGYDSCLQGVGRLCQITDESGVTDYAYTGYGNVLSEIRTQDGISFVTEYGWDQADRVISMTYPNGRTITILRDAIGRVVSVDSTLVDTTRNVVHSRTYRGDGLLTSQTFGNGLNETRDYDTQGRLINQQIGHHETRQYDYDANGNVLSIVRPVEPVEYQYDALDRLNADNTATDVDSVITQIVNAWQYDGNRLSEISGVENPTPDCNPDLDDNCDVVCTPGSWCFAQGEKTRQYVYTPNSNILTQRGNKTHAIDAAGNTLSDRNGKRQYAYNDAGRLFQFYKRGVLKAEYTYNAQNQRTKKVVHKAPDEQGNPVYNTLHFIYDVNGNLISEYRNGKPLRDYLWAEGQLLQRDRLKLKNNGDLIVRNTLFVVTDHLNTPRLAMDDLDRLVWRWDSDAFGKGGINRDPDGDGKKRRIRLRFPGQYWDAESGLFYNWNRYYDRTTGRYVTSDPIGLQGGINTYGYAGQNPLVRIDSTGQSWKLVLDAGKWVWKYITKKKKKKKNQNGDKEKQYICPPERAQQCEGAFANCMADFSVSEILCIESLALCKSTDLPVVFPHGEWVK